MDCWVLCVELIFRKPMKPYTLLLMSSVIWAQNTPSVPELKNELTSLEVEVGTVEEAPPLDVLPQIIEFIEADYPITLQQKGVEGIVSLEVLIDEKGRVETASVIQGLDSELDQAALAAIKDFLFSPAVAQGEAVAVAIQYDYEFSLKETVESITEFVNFEGELNEKGTRSPIADAMVVVEFLEKDKNLPVPFDLYMNKIGEFEGQYLEDGSLVTLTDSLGHFKFSSLPSGKVKIKFPVSGYASASFEESIARTDLVKMDYKLYRESYDDYEVVVYGKAEKKEVSKRSLNIHELKRVPGFGGDAIKVIRSLPGVARPSFVSGDIIIRGSGTEDSRFFLDGVEVPRLFHFGGLRSIYSSDLLGGLDMYPGGFNTRYGGAVGGVVEIKGRKAKSDRWHGKIDVNMLETSAMLEGPVSDKVTLQVAGAYSYIGKVVESTTKDLPMTIVPVYWDGLVRLDYEHSPSDNSFFTYSTSKDELEITTNQKTGGTSELGSPNTASSEDWYQMFILGNNYKITPKLKNELRLSFTHSTTSMQIFGMTNVEFDEYSYYARDEIEYKANDYFTPRVGLDANLKNTVYDFSVLSVTGLRPNAKDKYFSTLGAYTNIDIKPTPKLKITPGVRYDYYTDIEEGAPSYRLSTRYEYLKGLSVKASAGTYSQAPKPWGEATDEEWGNPDLPATEAIQYTLGHEWEISDLISLDVQGYYNTQDLIPSYTDSLNPNSSKAINYLPEMEARMYGLETMLKHDQGKRFFGWISYSLSRSERKSPFPFFDQAAGSTEWDKDEWVLSPLDQTHNVQVVASWRWPGNWETGFRLQYVTGNPETPTLAFHENHSSYNADHNEYEIITGKPNSERQDDFVQLDIRVEKKWIMDSWLLNTYVDVRNATYFWYNSPEQYQYNYDQTERETVGSIFLPSIGISASF